ncbi:MAG: hypothetical protein KDC38_03575 [Planctomycetes bacterium]|nr:hypothetical protein [Planctomycetota bacterium]
MKPRTRRRGSYVRSLGVALVALMCASGSLSAGVGAWQFIRGDFNGDGVNDVADGVGILSYLFVAGSAAPLCEDAADVNDDGVISLVDAVYQLTHALAGGAAPPAPYPTCGVDLSFDSLGCDGPLAFCDEANLPPNLVVAFSDDALEDTPGVRMSPNIASVTPSNFAELRFGMRPVLVQLGATAGTVEITQTGPIQLYDSSGNLLGNPASVPAASLPTELLINATGIGEASLVAVHVGVGGSAPDAVTIHVSKDTGIAGRDLSGYPHYEFVRTINDDSIVQAGIEPNRHAERAGLPYRAYVVAHRTPAQWAADNTLVDVSGGFELGTVNGSSIQTNITDVWTSGLDSGTGVVGVGYDLVLDFGLDGTLDPGDMIDGLAYGEAGFYIIGDMTAMGPHAVTETIYSGGTFLGQDLYYPTDIATLSDVPIVVISHGNGHMYTWYDYLGIHLASWGYVVMSHQNNTGPGIETSSTTTLTNTDYLLDNLATIAGGALLGRVDTNWIAWVGHSRGGEGVARAYDRLVEGTAPAGMSYTPDQIKFICSIAPTVFLGTAASDPHDVAYNLLAGAADGDVNGCADCDICQFFRIHQRGTGTTSATYVQGASHNDFNCCGFADGTGPLLIGRPAAQTVAKSYLLAHMEYLSRGNLATKDFLVRNFNAFHPIGIPGNVVVANQWKDPSQTADVIDSYQTQTSTGVSSSGGAVAFDVSNVNEGIYNDNNTTFTWTTADPMNGMTQASSTPDDSRGVVFDWPSGSSRFYQWEVPAAQSNFADDSFLTLRACQGTRHPNTNALAGTLNFTVTLTDTFGTSSSINITDFGTITRPYQRSRCGTGSGWANEFNIVRLRVADFENDASGIDLSTIATVRLDFGPGLSSTLGRIGVDDLQLTED